MSAYFQPWIIARITLSSIAIFAALRGFQMGLRILRGWHLGASSEGQLALERRAELVSTLVMVGLLATVSGLVITLYGADRQADTLEGAMCAYGVFESGTAGFTSLTLAFTAAFGCALWLLFHRIDMRYETPTFTRGKFLLLYVLTPFILLDGVFFLRFVSGLDLSAGGTCCSAELGAAGGEVAGANAGLFGLGASASFIAFMVFAFMAAGALFLSSRIRHAMLAASFGAFSGLLALAIGANASARFVAPHVYETPHHTCPFCLLHGSYAPFGWALLATFFSASVYGAGTALAMGLDRGMRASPAYAVGVQFGRRSAALWAFAALLALAPIAIYFARTGTLLV